MLGLLTRHSESDSMVQRMKLSAPAAHDVRTPMLPRMIPMSSSRARTTPLARDAQVLAEMMPGHVVVMAADHLHIGIERRDLSEDLYGCEVAAVMVSQLSDINGVPRHVARSGNSRSAEALCRKILRANIGSPE
jgi:hypothetical protein